MLFLWLFWYFVYYRLRVRVLQRVLWCKLVVIGMWRVVSFEIVQCFHFSFPPQYQKKKFVNRVLIKTSLFVCNYLNCYAASQCSNVFFDIEHNPSFVELSCISSLRGSSIENAVDLL